MPPQQHLYNGLARHVDYYIFAREWTRLSPGQSMLNGVARMDSMLAYGQRGSLARDSPGWTR